jgi:hypothetical protein
MYRPHIVEISGRTMPDFSSLASPEFVEGESGAGSLQALGKT